jgi:hypothetical protein
MASMASASGQSRSAQIISAATICMSFSLSSGWLAAPQVSLAAVTPPPGVVWSSVVDYTNLAHVAADGTTLWFGALAGGVVEWDTVNKTFRSYTQSSHALPSNQIQGIAVDTTGAVWIATFHGLGERPAGAAAGDPWITYDETNSGLTDNLVNSVSADPAGGIWVGTYSGGLFHYDGQTWVNYTVANSGLTDLYVTSTATDLAGDLWLGAWSDGVNRFDGANWTRYTRVNTGTPPPPAFRLIHPMTWGCSVRSSGCAASTRSAARSGSGTTTTIRNAPIAASRVISTATGRPGHRTTARFSPAIPTWPSTARARPG